MTDGLPIKKRKELYSDPFLRVAEQTFEHEGDEYRYFIKEEPEFAVVGAVTDDNQIIMVRQFRPGPRRFLFDLPGGMVEEGDSPLETACKELLEETGYSAEDIEFVASAYPMAYTTAKKHIFVATGCTKVKGHEDEPNMIAEPVLLSFTEFGDMVAQGNVLDLDAMMVLAQRLNIQISFSASQDA
ncbi:MAG: NUDIX hydrolase [Kordiimonadaceae bacterium]|nr:NUDIX hydrolase [Kordiimonadaceae bacterium]MBO6569815.1 NUDIX hydrolase [Kordiimonadaceae bacterium]MBO6966089.1 NUDIX hydrolase [Kordiimonadaceae bacterium]